MKKHLYSLLLLATILLMVVFTACSSEEATSGTSGTSDDPTVLTLWHYYNGGTKEMMDSLVLEFNETVGKEKGIIIDAYSYASVPELAEAVLASGNKEVGAAAMPDIFAAYPDNALIIDNLGLVADLAPYFTEEELALYRPEFIEEGRLTSDGGIKIIPVAKSTEIMYINKTDFDKLLLHSSYPFSIDKLSTWEGIAELSEAYYLAEGEAFFGIDSIPNFMIVAARQLGQDIYNSESGTVGFNLSEENARKIWDYLYAPYIKGHYASFGRFRSDDIKSGDLLAYVGSTASTLYFPTEIETGKDEVTPIECVTIPYPYFEGGEKIAVSQGAGMVVSKSDEVRESAAVDFLKWFTLPENNMEFAVSTGYMPVQNEALNYDSIIELIEQEGNAPSAVISSTETIYKAALSSYTLYTNKPFEGSYEVRSAMESSILEGISADLATLNERVAAGEVREDVIAELINDEHFKKWYDRLVELMQETLQ